MQRRGWWQPAKRVNLTTIWRGGWHDREGAVPGSIGARAPHHDESAQGLPGGQGGSEAARQVQVREGPGVDVRDGAEGERAGARRRNRVRQNGEGARTRRRNRVRQNGEGARDVGGGDRRV